VLADPINDSIRLSDNDFTLHFTIVSYVCIMHVILWVKSNSTSKLTQLTLHPISCKLQFDFIRDKKSGITQKRIGLGGVIA
jgi:hypothetical protein